MSQRDKQQLQLSCSDFVTRTKSYITRYQINNNCATLMKVDLI